MSEIDDAAEWAAASENFKSNEDSGSQLAQAPDGYDDDDYRDENKKVGQPNQYALYGPGYMATTPTVKILPPACYDIESDNRGVYVVPSIAPAGLLLELPEMRSEEVIRVVENFWNSEKDYKEGNDYVIGGAAFKAGVMIYGPPGSGKSCTIKLVSKKLIEKGGTVFFANTSPQIVMAWLNDFARVEPSRKSIVILEDVDSLIENYGEARYLEMLDSAKTINNVLFIATTNYPEKLDPRIYNRPGRFSHVIKIGYPTAKAREAYLKAVLKKHDQVDFMVENTDKFTIDHLSALINAVYREKKDLDNEIKRLKTLFKIPPKSDGDGPKIGIAPED